MPPDILQERFEELLDQVSQEHLASGQGTVRPETSSDGDSILIMRALAYVLEKTERLVEEGASALRSSVGTHLFPTEFVPKGSMLVLEQDSNINRVCQLPSGTEFFLRRPNLGTQRFRKIANTPLSPFRIKGVRHSFNDDRQTTDLTILLKGAVAVDALEMGVLRFLLRGPIKTRRKLYRSFRRDIKRIVLQMGAKEFSVDLSKIRNVFEGNKFLQLAGRNQGDLAFDIVEYFLNFPEVLLNFELKLDDIRGQWEAMSADDDDVPGLTDSIEIRFEFEGDVFSGIELNPKHFVFNPILAENTYIKPSSVTFRNPESEAMSFDIGMTESDSEFAIDVLHVFEAGSDEDPAPSFISATASERGVPNVRGRFQLLETGPSRGSVKHSPLKVALADNVRQLFSEPIPFMADLLCTNGEAVQGLEAGATLRAEHNELGVLVFRSVTPSTRYQSIDGDRHQLLNELLDVYGCDINVFGDTARFKAIWMFFVNRMQLPARETLKYSKGLLSSSLDVRQIIENRGSIPSYDLRIIIDDTVFSNGPELFVFADVMHMLMVRMCPINSVCNFEIESSTSGEVRKWPTVIASERLTP
ncbi:type VI secretion system baseplate subunit TssF [Gammaproteobacteria bacterium]|nr:type VI secretion system baseplate subunit TssF [Gammaproteobacteria bacterium]